MSLEKIAEILGVDSVDIRHGRLGVAVYVKSGGATHVATIDNDDLVKSRGARDNRNPAQRRLETIAEHLVFLADGDLAKTQALRKSQADAATRAAIRADEAPRPRRPLPWNDVGGFGSALDGDSLLQQLVKSDPAASSRLEIPPAPAAEPAAESMPSRFHAIMAELRCL